MRFLTAAIAMGLACGVVGDELFNGEELIFPKNATGSQMASTVLVTKNKKIIVIDGGTNGDYKHLLEIIRPYGTTVSQWYLTHAHDDHTNALIELFNKEPEALKVDEILYQFPPLDWIKETNARWPSEWQPSVPILESIPKIPSRHTVLKKGDHFDIDGVAVDVLNDYNPEIRNNSINNASIALMFTIAGKKLLLPGDQGVEMGDFMVKELGDKLKADIVLMAHHGQNGVGKNYYEKVKPSICVWPTPEWLWNNDIGGGPGSGPWKTNYVKCWMQDIGVKTHYPTYKGDVVLK